MDKIDELLTRGVANIIPNKEALSKVLKSDKKINVYFGIDPTATRIHLGYAVPLRKLQTLAELGHNVTFLIGDFTALIGDTSDKDTERPVLTKEQIEENFRTYKKQAEKIVDFSKVQVRHNSEWLAKLTFEDIIKLCQHYSFGDFASRELIKKRLTEGKKVGLHEALYPVMQGYDSYFLDTDLQLGGTDQTFNMQAGRLLQKDLRQKESFVMANGFLTGTDGRKMSKSWGNAIWLEDEPNVMYGKVMSLNDDLIMEYLTFGTNLASTEIDDYEKRLKSGENPMAIKKILAYQITKELHNESAAQKAQDEFQSVVQNRELPADIPVRKISSEILEDRSIVGILVACGLASSKSEARRLVEQGAVEIDGEKITDPHQQIDLKNGTIIRAGRQKYVKIEID